MPVLALHISGFIQHVLSLCLAPLNSMRGSSAVLHEQSLHLNYYAILPLVRLTNSVLPPANVSLESSLGYSELAEPQAEGSENTKR